MRHAIVKEHEKDEGEIIYKVLENIIHKWGISSDILAKIIHVDSSTYRKWEQAKKVPFKKESTNQKEEVIKTFLRLDKYLSQMFYNVEDQRVWLTSKHNQLGVVPLEYLQGSLDNLFNLKNYLSWAISKGA